LEEARWASKNREDPNLARRFFRDEPGREQFVPIGEPFRSPVSITFRKTPVSSEYAKYFPSGEMLALFTGVSNAFVVNCLCLSSASGLDCRRAYQPRPSPIARTARTPDAIRIFRQRVLERRLEPGPTLAVLAEWLATDTS